MQPKYKRIMIKLSGQVLEGKQEQGIDHQYVQKLCESLKEIKEKHQLEIAIVIGGGNFWRYRDFQDSAINRVDSDYMGMLATVMNSVALKNTLESVGVAAEVCSALPIKNIAPEYNRPEAIKHFQNNKIVICGGGTGNPFFTTDSAAALRALELECDVLLKATKVNGVFDKDPEKHADAKHFPQISYTEVLEKNLQVMDLTAIALCKEKPLPIIVFDINNFENIEKAILGEPTGSLIQ